MNQTARIFFILTTFFTTLVLFASPVEAKFIGAKRPFCSTCCSQSSPDGTLLNGNCSEQCSSGGCVTNTDGLLSETQSVINTSSTHDEGLSLSLRYASNNANGESVSLDTLLGFGWSHSYNIFLFSQGSDVFKMSSGGIVTKYQRSGRSGPLRALNGTQQTAIQNPDGSIDIANLQGGTIFHFEKIPGNPLRVAAVEPWMLKSVIDRNDNKTELAYQNGLLALVTDIYGRQIKFEYNSNKHLTKITDPLNRVTQLVYGGYNNLTKISDPLGNTVQYSYDQRHQIIGKIDKNNNTFRYTYNATGHLVAITDQAGSSILKLSNPNDWATNTTELSISKLRMYIPSVTTQTDGNEKQWQYFYNTDGQTTKTVAPDNATTTYTYDPATLNMTSMTNANGHITRYEYDTYGNRSRQIDANGNEIRYEYNNPFNFVTRMSTFANGSSTAHSVTTYEYDVSGNRVREMRDVSGLNLVSEWTYDTQGHVIQEKDPNAHITSYEYDAFGNQITVTDPENHITRYEYDLIGNKTKMIDANGHIWLYDPYDSINRLLTETDPLGFVTNYTYDGNGNRIQVQKQATKAPDTFQITQYQYDLRDRLIKETRDPAGLNLVTAYIYDNNDNRIQLTDPRGKVTSYSYDVQNRLTLVKDALTHTSETRYDPVGNRVCTIDANQHYTFFNYDALNRQITESRKIGAQECNTSDADDIITQTFYDSGNGIPPIYCLSLECEKPTPGSGIIAHTIDPEGKYTYFKYDGANRRVMTIRKMGDVADDFDKTGNPAEDDWSEIIQYDAVGNVLSRIDANGNRTNYSYYDNNWLKTETTDPGGLNLTTATIYDGVGSSRTVTNPRGNVITNTYDARNQLVMVTDSIGKVAEYQYDGIGNRIVERDGNQGDTDPFTVDTPAVPETRYAYDAVNRLIEATDPLGNHSANDYDNNGNLIKVIDRENHVSCHYYDNINRRTRNAQLMGGSDCALLSTSDLWTDTEYDAVGNVIRLITAKQSPPAACASASPPDDCETTHYQYDPADRLVLETYADSTTRQFAYDKASNLNQRTDQLGQVTKYSYNDLYYLVERDYQDSAELDDSFGYDVGGRMLLAQRGTWAVNFDHYDAANRLLQTTQDATGLAMTVQYTYNTTAGIRDVIYPGGRLCNEQNDLRQRLEGNTCGGFNAEYAYDLGNRVDTRTYNNGVTAHYGYDANNRITSLSHSSGVADFGYDYDKEGNKQFEQKNHEPAKSEAYAYDEVYRLIDYKIGTLVGSTVPVPSTQKQYDLDKVGNWDQLTNDTDGAGPGVPIVYKNTSNQMNEYDDPSTNGLGEIPDDLGVANNFKNNVATPALDGENWKHDKNGNRREDGKRIYVYDDENRLIQITRKSDNLVSKYQYDALSRRVVKTVGVVSPVATRFAYDDARIIEEQNNTAATQATYVYGNYIDEVLNMQRGGVDYYYHQNALWSVAAITNAAGVVVEKYAYSDYGCPSLTHSVIGNPWLFTGRQWDEESGVYFYRARYYDCEAGRFLQRDPLGYVDGMNLYEFVRSTPLNLVDPFGFIKAKAGYRDYYYDPRTKLKTSRGLALSVEAWLEGTCDQKQCKFVPQPIGDWIYWQEKTGMAKNTTFAATKERLEKYQQAATGCPEGQEECWQYYLHNYVVVATSVTVGGAVKVDIGGEKFGGTLGFEITRTVTVPETIWAANIIFELRICCNCFGDRVVLEKVSRSGDASPGFYEHKLGDNSWGRYAWKTTT